MSDTSSIEWTDSTWNPVRGCTKVSQGCKFCYAETFAERFRGVAGHPYEQGFDLRLVPEKLDEPLLWRKPRKVFVNSMSDLFHDDVPFEFIAAVYGVMAVSPHTFQVLTKRPERRLEFHRWLKEGATPQLANMPPDLVVQRHARRMIGERFPLHPIKGTLRCYPWPLRNVWEGVSTENQETADERIPLLLQTPAAVRFVSAEPLLGPIDFRILAVCAPDGLVTDVVDSLTCEENAEDCGAIGTETLDLVIVGGESGHGARPMEIAWARSIRQQCADAEVAFFMKQGGARPKGWCVANLHSRDPDNVVECDSYDSGEAGHCGSRCQFLRHRKGADLAELPEDLRVRELPA